ncbi:hypothetical protein Efla_006810 [Eimeria flavescens]
MCSPSVGLPPDQSPISPLCVTPLPPRPDGDRQRLVPPRLALPSLPSRRGDHYPLPATPRAASRATPRHPVLPVPSAIVVPHDPRPRARPLVSGVAADMIPGPLGATSLASLPRPPVVRPELQHGAHPSTPSGVTPTPHLALSYSRARPFALGPPALALHAFSLFPIAPTPQRRTRGPPRSTVLQAGSRARPLEIALDHISFLLQNFVERNMDAKFPNRRRTYLGSLPDVACITQEHLVGRQHGPDPWRRPVVKPIARERASAGGRGPGHQMNQLMGITVAGGPAA